MTGEPTIGIELTPEVPLSRLRNLAKAAESLGFNTIFVSHHYNNRDEFVALADVAQVTDEVRLGPGVTNPYETHPVTLASRMATLDELSDGRGVFGVGAGDRSTLRNLGFERESPLRRVLESIRVSRRLWDGEQVDHDGTFVANDATLNFDAGRIPVYVGAQGPHMTRMAAKHADGILFNGSHPLDVEWAAERVAEGREARPAERGSVDFVVYGSVSIARDGEAAREAARPPVAFIVGGASPTVLERHDIDEGAAEQISEAIEAGNYRTAFDRVTPAMIDRFCIAGTPENVEGRLENILDVADGFVMGSPLGPDLGTALELMGDVWPPNPE